MGADAHIKAALHLATAGGFGPQAFGALSSLGGPEAMLRADPHAVRPLLRADAQLAAWAAARQAFLRGVDEGIAQSLRLLDRFGIWVRGDADYPRAILDIPDAPIVLMHVGQGLRDALAQACVALVGAREANPYGLSVTRKTAHALSNHGVTVVSGAAKGVDTAAHDAVLQAGGRTVAVLGETLDTADGKRMEQQMLERGGLVTEVLPEVPQHSGSFARRNRIITGLCRVVVVVQGAAGSGTLHTARFAREQKRILMAVPGQVTDPLSWVPHALMEQGAPGAFHVESILKAAGLDVRAEPAAELAEAVVPVNLSPQQTRLLEALQQGAAVELDVVVEQTGLAPSDVSRLMLELELMGLCKRAPGGAYARA